MILHALAEALAYVVGFVVVVGFLAVIVAVCSGKK